MNENEYELIYITKVGFVDAKVQKLESRINRAFERHKGVHLETRDLGEKALLYPIQKEQKGKYTFVRFRGRGGLASEIESELRLFPEILRFLTVKVEKNPEKRRKEDDKPKDTTTDESNQAAA